MYSPFMWDPMTAFGVGAFAGVVLILTLWSLVWKGLAFWHAARNGQIVWFIAFLLIHTAGILEIVYLVWFRKDKAARSFASLFSFGTPKVPEQTA